MITKKKVMISLDKEVLRKVDMVRGLVPRSAWIEDKLKKVCEADPKERR